MYDIAIVGMGPAGATLARLLRKTYKVIVIDRRKPKTGKCCGGLLSPDAQKILAQFDLCLPKDVLADPQIFAVKTMDLDNNIERFYQRSYLNMNRAKFEAFLVSLIPENVTIRDAASCVKIERKDQTYSLDLKSKRKPKTIKAKIVVGADGANSIVRNTFYTNKKIHKYTAIQEWYKAKKLSPFYSCVFDRTLTDSYCWTISKDKHFIIGGAFPTTGSGQKFEMLKEKIKHRGIAFAKSVKKEACFVYLNKSLTSTCTGKNGAYLVGEAAGMISPSSLEGISYAMDSAKLLAEILNGNTENAGLPDNVSIARKYFRKSLGIRVKLFLKLFKMLFMYGRILRAIVMKSGVRAIGGKGVML